MTDNCGRGFIRRKLIVVSFLRVAYTNEWDKFSCRGHGVFLARSADILCRLIECDSVVVNTG